MVTVAFRLLLATRPSIVKLEVEGTATLTGKDNEISKMLEIEPEREVPYVFHKIYQNAFEAMYLLSTILKAPPPPYNLLSQQTEGTATEDVHIESVVGEAQTKKDMDEGIAEPSAVEVEEAMIDRPETINREDAETQAVQKAGEEPAEKEPQELSNT
ncbi:hypothetical protein GTO27_09705 [Candidatus Bathyarchaeota archaeon]|nr:hypothetical protein [Candidatus Bathyarchaeota archaeon]